jgi:hypothetical protein
MRGTSFGRERIIIIFKKIFRPRFFLLLIRAAESDEARRVRSNGLT